MKGHADLLTREDLAARDENDPLRAFRGEFSLPDGVIYLDGNSLGALPKAAASRVERVVQKEWGDDLIRGWNEHEWIGMPSRVGDKIGRLIGAKSGEVVVADSTSINLYKLLAGALGLRPGRHVVVTEEGNFPTDVYMAEGLLSLLGDRHELRPAPWADIASAIDDETAVVMLTQVNYQTGELHDLEAMTHTAHEPGALMLWDLSHSAGAVPIDLSAAEVDLAVGCGYKYLNGGPGAPAFLYVAQRHQDGMRPALSGWMGHADPFSFESEYRPAEGIARHLVGTPPILSMVALEEAVDLFLRADMKETREKSVLLTEAFIQLVRQECGDAGFEVASPQDPDHRGSQVSLRHADGYPIMQALIARGVIGDFRPPDLLRFGFAPLYIRHVDVWEAVATLRDIMESGAWDRPEFQRRAAVT